ncbi:hypothetical protein L204_104516 [Cryptococcus depauperatus]
MALKTLTVLLFVLGAKAQFGPSSSVETLGSTSLRSAASATSSVPPPPAESTGCKLHEDHYHCEGPALKASQTASGTVPPPPAESTGCVLHVDHYHCKGPAEGHTGSPTTASPTVPSPTESSNCFWHETHWDCFDTAAEAEEAQSADKSGKCIIHVGHTHGDCSAKDLACGAVLLENYNMGLHIGALFIILITSGLGVLIPLISRWLRDPYNEEATGEIELYEGTVASSAAFGKNVGWWDNVFFIARHFGTGIIISTAFIHLLYHGFVMFANKCVGRLSYESTSPAIAMAAAIVTFLLDLMGTRYAHKNGNAVLVGSPQLEEGIKPKGSPQEASGHHPHDGGCGSRFDAALAAEQNHQVLLLEAGIIFHSIMIGVTLGAGGGEGWTTLLIVIIFHQMFEGLALGARIALLEWISRTRAIFMGLAFTLITPIGIAIGIGVRKSFSQNGRASLLSVGILNSMSAGILLYTAFKLLSSDFTEGPLRDAKLYKVLVALGALVAGLIAMSVLGKWA